MKKSMFMLAIALPIMLTGCWDRGQGEKPGVIVKMAKQGLFCKTWEGELIRGGLSGGSGVMGAPFRFTVEDDEVAKQLFAIMESQKEIRLKYRAEVITFCSSDSNHFVTGYEIVDTPTSNTITNSVQQPTISNADVVKILEQQTLILEKLTNMKTTTGE